MLTISPFVPSADAYEAVAAVAAAEPDELCDFEYATGAELRELDDGFARVGAQVRRHVADVGGAVAGYAYSFPTTWAPETGRHWVALRVRREHRGQGVGRALLRLALADVRAGGARAAILMCRESQAWTAEVLARRGFRELLRSWPYTLDPRGCDTVALTGYLERAAAAGITFTTLAEERARRAGWAEPLFELHAALTREVPLPETPNMTLGWFTAFAEVLPEAFFIAVDGGRYVGESFMHPSAGEERALTQRTTGVLPAWRGRGVATALKLLTVEYARRSGHRRIDTWVESSNAAMIAVCERLGFTPGLGQVVFEGAVDAAGSVW